MEDNFSTDRQWAAGGGFRVSATHLLLCSLGVGVGVGGVEIPEVEEAK